MDRTIIARVNHTGYGCTRCQQIHEVGDPLYADHLYWQDKHGVKTWTTTTCWRGTDDVLARVPACEVLLAGEY